MQCRGFSRCVLLPGRSTLASSSSCRPESSWTWCFLSLGELALVRGVLLEVWAPGVQQIERLVVFRLARGVIDPLVR